MSDGSSALTALISPITLLLPARKSAPDTAPAAQTITANYGDPIPWFAGTARIAPQVWWVSEPRKRTASSGGKGGGQATTSTTYVRDVLFGLTSNEAVTVSRMWRNGDLVWTSLPDASIASLNASLESNQWSRVTIYPGSASQMPDPTMEAVLGAGNVPAYRDRCSVFFQDLNCGPSGTLDNWTMEVVQSEFSHLVFSAPMTADPNDIIAPAAGIATYPEVAGTFSSSGVLIQAVANGHNDNAYYYNTGSGSKLDITSSGTRGLYQVQMDVTFSFNGATALTGDYIRFLIFGSGVRQQGFAYVTYGTSTYLVLYSSTPGDSTNTVVGYAPPNGRYRLEIDTKSTPGSWSTKWIVNGAVLRTSVSDFVPYGAVYYGILGRNGQAGVSSILMKNCNVLVTGNGPFDGSVTLQSVVEALCARASMPAGTYDATALAAVTKPVRSLLLSQIAPTRQALETLRAAFFFDAVVSDKLYFRPRATSATLTIAFDDLAAGADAASGDPLALKQSSDLELPAQVSVSYKNVPNDYQAGTELSDRLGRGQVALQTVDIALGMTPTEAKAVADALLLTGYTSQTTGEISVPLYYAQLEAGDVVTVDGQALRLVRKQDADGILKFEVVRYDSSAIISAGITDGNYTPASEVRQASDTVWQVLDMPLARSTDDGPGYYVAAHGASLYWPGASIQSSVDNASFSEVATIAERAVFGVTTTTLATFSGSGLDESNTVTVNVGVDSLSSSTRDAMALDETINTMLIGSEVVRFVTATLVTANPNIYTLKRLTRGHRGTEWAVGTHATGETCTLLTARGLRHVAVQQSDIGATRYIKGVTAGAALSSAVASTYTLGTVVQKPYAVSNLRATSDSLSTTLTWDRRSRIPSSMFRGSVLAEDVESYDVELRDGSNVLQQSATVSGSTFTASSYIAGDFILPQIWGIRSVSGNLLAVHDPQAKTTGYGGKRIVAVTAGGDFTDFSVVLGEQIHQWTNNGDAVYAAVSNLNTAATPAYFTASRVVKMTRGTLATTDASVTAGTAGDYAGIAHDGTDVWVSEQTSGNVRRLNSSTLASIAAYAVAGTPTALAYNSGKLWILCQTSRELVKFDTTTRTEDARIALSDTPFDVRIASGKVYVACASSLQVFDEAAATLTVSYAYGANWTSAQRSLTTFGTYVVADCYVLGVRRLVLLTATMGAIYRVLGIPVASFYFCAGEFGGSLYMTIAVTPASSLQTRKYTLAPPNLSGYTATVWQRSAAVGRGYPTTLAL